MPTLSDRVFEALLESIWTLFPEEPPSSHAIPFSIDTRSSSPLTRFLLRVGSPEALEFRRAVIQQELHRGRVFDREVVEWLADLPEARAAESAKLDSHHNLQNSENSFSVPFSDPLDHKPAFWASLRHADRLRGFATPTASPAGPAGPCSRRIDLTIPVSHANQRLTAVTNSWSHPWASQAPKDIISFMALTPVNRITSIADQVSLRKLPGVVNSPWDLWGVSGASTAATAVHSTSRETHFPPPAFDESTATLVLSDGAGDAELATVAAGVRILNSLTLHTTRATHLTPLLTNLDLNKLKSIHLVNNPRLILANTAASSGISGNTTVGGGVGVAKTLAKEKTLLTVLSESKLPSLMGFCLSEVKSSSDVYSVLKQLGSCVRLQSLELRSIELGRWSNDGPTILASLLLELPNLTALDVSGNFFRGSTLAVVGEALVRMACVEELRINDNAGEPQAVLELCARLGEVGSLKKLELKNSGVDDHACFCLFDAFQDFAVKSREGTRGITHIDVSHNPNINLLGLRSLLLIYLLNGSMSFLGIRPVPGATGSNGSSSNSNGSSSGGSRIEIDLADLSGTYRLEGTPFNRALVRECVKRWQQADASLPFNEVFLDCRLDGKLLTKIDKYTDGLLTFIYVQPGSRSSSSSGSSSGSGSGSSSDGLIKGSKRELSNEGFTKLIRIWNSSEQVNVAEALSRDFQLSGEQLIILVEKTKEGRIKVRLLKGFVDKLSINTFKLFHVWNTLLPPTTTATTKEGKKKRINFTYMSYTSINPTGHYVLDLENPGDQMVAEALLLSNRREREELKKRADVSQKGNFACIRNEVFNGKEFRITQDWNLPSSGILEFDYVESKRAFIPAVLAAGGGGGVEAGGVVGRPGSTGTSRKKYIPETEVLNELVKFLKKVKTEYGVNVCLGLLRRATGRVFLTCEKVDIILSQIGEGNNEMMRDIFVTLYARIVDYGNIREHFFRAKLGLPAIFNAGDLEILERRLGKLAFFNPMKVDNFRFFADLSDHQGRLIAVIMMTLLTKEKNNRLINNEIDKVPCPEVPADWKTKQIPYAGSWSATYLSDEGGAIQTLRSALAAKYCGFDSEIK